MFDFLKSFIYQIFWFIPDVSVDPVQCLVELDHAGVAAAEFVVRAVAADDDVSLLSTAMDRERHRPAMERLFCKHKLAGSVYLFCKKASTVIPISLMICFSNIGEMSFPW